MDRGGGVMAKRAALRGFLRPARSSLVSKYKDYLNLVSLKKKKRKEETSASPATFF